MGLRAVITSKGLRRILVAWLVTRLDAGLGSWEVRSGSSPSRTRTQPQLQRGLGGFGTLADPQAGELETVKNRGRNGRGEMRRSKTRDLGRANGDSA